MNCKEIPILYIGRERILGVGQQMESRMRVSWDWYEFEVRRYNSYESATGCKRAWEVRVHRKNGLPGP